MPVLTHAEAIVVGLLQGVTELSPVCSLGHGALIPAIAGGRRPHDLNISAPEPLKLAFVRRGARRHRVGADGRISGGTGCASSAGASLRPGDRHVETADQQLAG
jgi:hypothetical protein